MNLGRIRSIFSNHTSLDLWSDEIEVNVKRMNNNEKNMERDFLFKQGKTTILDVKKMV